MAKTPKTVHFIVLLFIIILLSNQEMAGVEAKLCAKRSKKLRGACLSSDNCNNKYRKQEKAVHGACHWQWPGFACVCYYNCH